MQGLSSRAHAFSVEALVGKKPCKIRKVSGGHDACLAAEARSDTGIFTGEGQLSNSKTKQKPRSENVIFFRCIYQSSLKKDDSIRKSNKPVWRGSFCDYASLSSFNRNSIAGNSTSSSLISSCTGLEGLPLREMKKEGSAPRRPRDSTCEPQRRAVRPRAEEAEAGGEQHKALADGDRGARVELQGSELWKRFYEIGTEMIITKAGR